MTHDPIVEEVHRIREEILAEFGGDLHALAAHVRKLEADAEKAGRKVVSLPPRRLPIEVRTAGTD